MSTKDLQAAYEAALTKAQAIMAEKDDAIAKVYARYGDKLRQANQDAADAHKLWRDADAAQALADREDGYAVAKSLGLLDAADSLGLQLAGDDRQ
jgi:hypothetical protein